MASAELNWHDELGGAKLLFDVGRFECDTCTVVATLKIIPDIC